MSDKVRFQTNRGRAECRQPRNCCVPEKGVPLEIHAPTNTNGIDCAHREDPAWREMCEIVDEIERNYSLEEIAQDDWAIYVEYCARLGEPVSERDLIRKRHPELYPEEIDFMLLPQNEGDCPF